MQRDPAPALLVGVLERFVGNAPGKLFFFGAVALYNVVAPTELIVLRVRDGAIVEAFAFFLQNHAGRVVRNVAHLDAAAAPLPLERAFRGFESENLDEHARTRIQRKTRCPPRMFIGAMFPELDGVWLERVARADMRCAPFSFSQIFDVAPRRAPDRMVKRKVADYDERTMLRMEKNLYPLLRE